ncbi:hypothetical protein SETIT_2G422700v2 [Setaria italica]|uniref:Uncharacterized protein n=1 Tax=Setaria italica TaxID=4555 RepID=A0A368Q8Y8_SETIT|nr:hypothetical protein SETIT_2G422700v2 [Setaria italica]
MEKVATGGDLLAPARELQQPTSCAGKWRGSGLLAGREAKGVGLVVTGGRGDGGIGRSKQLEAEPKAGRGRDRDSTREGDGGRGRTAHRRGSPQRGPVNRHAGCRTPTRACRAERTCPTWPLPVHVQAWPPIELAAGRAGDPHLTSEVSKRRPVMRSERRGHHIRRVYMRHTRSQVQRPPNTDRRRQEHGSGQLGRRTSDRSRASRG